MDEYGNKALVIIAAIATVLLLYWGEPFFVPLLMALMISYALSPLTDALTKLLRVRALAAATVVAAMLGIAGWGVYAWSDDVARLWNRIPEVTHAVSASVRKLSQHPTSAPSPVAEVKKAAAEIEALAAGSKPAAAAAAPPAPPPSTPSIWSIAYLGGKTAASAAAQTIAVIFLVFFMLASGDTFKRKLVRMFGTTLSEKKITVQTIDEIDAQIRRYLVVVFVSNVLVGLGTYIAFRILGVSYPELWGAFAAVVHTAPYFGPAVVAAGSLFAAFVQFNDWGHAFLVSGVTIGVATLVGSVFATWLSAKQMRMNTTATFVGLLFFGWIWGLWGILLAIPLLAMVKAVCEKSEGLANVAELLASEEPKRPPATEDKDASEKNPDAPDVEPAPKA